MATTTTTELAPTMTATSTILQRNATEPLHERLSMNERQIGNDDYDYDQDHDCDHDDAHYHHHRQHHNHNRHRHPSPGERKPVRACHSNGNGKGSGKHDERETEDDHDAHESGGVIMLIPLRRDGVDQTGGVHRREGGASTNTNTGLNTSAGTSTRGNTSASTNTSASAVQMKSFSRKLGHNRGNRANHLHPTNTLPNHTSSTKTINTSVSTLLTDMSISTEDWATNSTDNDAHTHTTRCECGDHGRIDACGASSVRSSAPHNSVRDATLEVIADSDLSSLSLRLPATSGARTATRRQHRRVRFGCVHVQYYPTILGDNPAVSCGLPISIGWDVVGTRTYWLDESIASANERAARGFAISPRHHLSTTHSDDQISNAQLPESTAPQRTLTQPQRTSSSSSSSFATTPSSSEDFKRWSRQINSTIRSYHRHGDDLKLSSMHRRAMLQSYAPKQLKAALKQCEKIQRQRQTTIQRLRLEKVQLTFEVVTKKFRQVVSLRR